jgi:two-component system chemotaxis response regulator CheY
MRILIVDDERGIRMVERRILSRMGPEVDEAADAPTGLAMALTGDYDLVLLDHALPGGNGASIAEAIGDAAGCEHTRVLMCTSMCGPAYEQRVLRAGAVGLLTKPFSLDDLTRWVNLVEEMTGRRLTATA